VRAAQDRFVHGEALFDAKQYAEAAVEFAAAYDLDPHAKFLLFNLALARRMAGACKDAIDAYRAFLDAGPPTAQVSKAKVGIERCEKILASQPGDTKAGDSKAGALKAGDTKAGDTKAGDAKAGDSKASDTKAGGAKAGDSKAGDSKAGEAKTGDTKAG